MSVLGSYNFSINSSCIIYTNFASRACPSIVVGNVLCSRILPNCSFLQNDIDKPDSLALGDNYNNIRFEYVEFFVEICIKIETTN